MTDPLVAIEKTEDIPSVAYRIFVEDIVNPYQAFVGKVANTVRDCVNTSYL